MQKKLGQPHTTFHGVKHGPKFPKQRKDGHDGGDREEKDEGKMTLRLLLEKILVSKSYGIYIEGLIFLACLLSTLGYIVTTYADSTYTWYELADFFVCGLFALEYFLFFYISQQKLSYMLNGDTVIDLYVFASIFIFKFVDWSASRLFIACSRLLRVIKISRIVKKWLQFADNSVNSQIFTIAITIFTIIYLFAGILQLIENQWHSGSRYQFHHMVYFAVVTFATVGYGDIVPQTTPGELCVVVIIIVVIVLIPKQSSDLLMLIDLQSPYARAKYKANPEIPHLIICGDVSVLALKNFCSELLHPDHGAQDKNAVILNESAPNTEMEMFLHDSLYEIYLTYLQGNPMIDRDLTRTCPNKAKLCVIFTDPSLLSHSLLLDDLAFFFSLS